jgi:hypothetical protein
MRNSNWLFTRVPVDILEAHGPFVRRYIEFPGGRKVAFSKRKADSCLCSEDLAVGIVPEGIDLGELTVTSARRKLARHKMRA